MCIVEEPATCQTQCVEAFVDRPAVAPRQEMNDLTQTLDQSERAGRSQSTPIRTLASSSGSIGSVAMIIGVDSIYQSALYTEATSASPLVLIQS